jgi:hypothetical protein
MNKLSSQKYKSAGFLWNSVTTHDTTWSHKPEDHNKNHLNIVAATLEIFAFF